MGKLLHGITGSFSGKVGGVLGSSWKGIPVIRKHFYPANPRTPLQQANRSQWGKAFSFASYVNNLFGVPYFFKPKLRLSLFNVMMKANYMYFSLPVQWHSIKFSQGDLEHVEDLEFGSGGSPRSFRMNWFHGVSGNGLQTDLVYFFMYNETAKYFDTIAPPYERSQNNRKYFPRIPSIGDVGHCWCWLVQNDINGNILRLSNTAYRTYTFD